MRDYKIIAVDFDGTLTCNGRWPSIGEPNIALITALRNRKQKGDKLILWTCREGTLLDKAILWCEEQGLVLDAVNANLPEIIAGYGNDSRKIFADWYIDDKSMNLQDFVVVSDKEMLHGKAEGNVMKKTEGILGTNDINYIYGLMNKLLCELEESEFYSYKPGTDEDGVEFYNMRLQNIRNEIDSRFCSKKDIRDKLYRLVEEEEELIKSYTQPGAPDRWMKANPRLRFYDCVFDFIEECPELYEQIRRGEVVTGIGEAMSFNFYPTEEECEARRRYFAELAEKSAKQNSGYSFERLYQNELVDTFRIIFEAEFA